MQTSLRASRQAIACLHRSRTFAFRAKWRAESFSSLSSPVSAVSSPKSSFADPQPTFFGTISTDSNAADDVDIQLRSDIKTMGSILGKIIKHYSGDDIFGKIESLRVAAKAWREAGSGRDSSQKSVCDAAFSSMSSITSSLNSDELMIVSRAFAHFCAIANAAESHHRSRKNDHKLRSSKQASIGAFVSSPDSCGGVLPQLMKRDDLSPQDIFESLITQQVELVLTAHPTEVNRRTLLDKHRRIQFLLTEADSLRNTNGAEFEKQIVNESLEREIALIWQSDELSREKPSVQSEAERGTLVVDDVLWEALPKFLRKLDATVKNVLGEQYSLPLDAVPIKFSSWMGGDRDGNAFVKPDITREICLVNRIRAAELLKRDLDDVASRLSTTFCNEELRNIVGSEVREPYRAFLHRIIKKLDMTINWAKQSLALMKNTSSSNSKNEIYKDIYLSKQELFDELLLIRKSLCETGNQLTADGKLLDVIRKFSAFGLSLLSLDIRQESTRHTEAVDAITRYLGVGSYSEWDERTKLNWLQAELASKRPLLRAEDWRNGETFSDTVVDTLETFQMISEQHEDSLGAYVISQATTASDVLAVLLLQINAGVQKPLRVVPLFETLDDLNGAASTIDTLFSLPAYRERIDNKQEIMIGYSDSAKDAGRLAASWAQYKTQEDLAKIADNHSIDLTFFHGKGGTVGRGGNPATFQAILSHAPNTIKGKFRVTEQGEMINQNFGHLDRAERTLDIYTAAVCAERHTERVKPRKEWIKMMDTISEISCDAYRNIVRYDDRFVPYFRSATPELELSELNIGSRPAKRKADGGVESLRAIPWNFAWTQTRLNLPTWLGVGEALGEILESENAEDLRSMYKNWDAFRTTIDLVEMVLAKSEPSIARHYEQMLVDDVKAKELGADIRKIHTMTEKRVLDLVDNKKLAERNNLLQSVLRVRNPYVDCMNLLQAEILKRLRGCKNEEERKVLKDALLISITGIANGMGNTG